ncbi:MAG: class I SAM-dependent methyltransferase [Acidobacteria bacterium]|nr:class I SAM-dependent methyltransferase [Acidobacteriota bacterium]
MSNREKEPQRFAFGENWRLFLASLSDERISAAQRSLTRALDGVTWNGARFLDVGCGSGLFSLVARRLGARVLSFDYDPQSVACTREIRRRTHPEDPDWVVVEGSVLDEEFLRGLGEFDVVYAWGSLHHTGDLWHATGNVVKRVRPGGTLLVSIYNDQGWRSSCWTWIKRFYNRLPPAFRFVVLVPVFVRLWAPRLVIDFLRLRPFHTWKSYGDDRGMTPWRNVIDWVGGYPFEVAKPEAVFEYHRLRGFELRYLKTCGGGHGCNEFAFRKLQAPHA